MVRGAESVTPEEVQRAWARQAQLDAARGVIECRMCRQLSSLDETTTVWRDGILVFAACDRCSQVHDIVFTPTERGVEVRARQRSPLVVGASR